MTTPSGAAAIAALSQSGGPKSAVAALENANVDIIGGEYLPKEVELLAHGGRLMIINLRGGKQATVDFGHVHSKHLTITGARLRPRSVAEKSQICRALEEHVWPLFADGTITPETCAVFPFSEAAQAHRLMESSEHIGKVLLKP